MKTAHGFSLIELMVAITIFAGLLALAMPSFGGWIRNARLRTTADSIQNGLQLARAEAVRRNAVVFFELTDNACAPTAGGNNWIVREAPPLGCADASLIQVRFAAAGTDNNTQLVSAGGFFSFSFDGTGRLTAPAVVADTITISPINGPGRNLNVVVTAGGQVRMCDPALPASDPQGC